MSDRTIRRPVLATCLAVFQLFAGCGDDTGTSAPESPRACDPGAERICTCDDGSPGVKRCSDDGVFGECSCAPGDDDEDEDIDGSTHGARSDEPDFIVQVLDPAGLPVDGATVTVDGGVLGTTDARGRLDVDTGAMGDFALAVTAPGFVDNVQRVERDGAPNVFVTSRLVPVGATSAIDAEEGGAVEHAGARVTFPPEAFVDADGEPVTGTVDVELTYVGPGQGLEALGTFDITGNEEEMLVSLGAVSLRASSSGTPVDLAPGAAATIAIPAPPGGDGAPPPPLWNQNAGAGAWDPNAGSWDYDADSQAWVAQVDALATWNCDYPTRVTCLRGGLTGPTGEPLSGVVVTGLIYGQAAAFLGGSAVQNATTGSEGTFCMEVVPDAQVDLSVTCPGGTRVELGTLTAPDNPGARCSGSCPDLGTRQVCCFRDSDCDEDANEQCVQGVCQEGGCDAAQTNGGDTPEVRQIELDDRAGSFTFSWDMADQKDRMIVTYEGAVLHDTGCVSGGGSVTLSYSGQDTFVTVEVTPNCEGGTGTVWSFNVGCPE